MLPRAGGAARSDEAARVSTRLLEDMVLERSPVLALNLEVTGNDRVVVWLCAASTGKVVEVLTDRGRDSGSWDVRQRVAEGGGWSKLSQSKGRRRVCEL